MLQDKLKKQALPVDLDELLKRCGGNADMAAAFLNDFRETVQDYFVSIPDDFAADQLGEIESSAHRLRGAASMMSANRIVIVASEVEACAKANDYSQVREAWPFLSNEIDAYCHWIDEHLRRIES